MEEVTSRQTADRLAGCSDGQVHRLKSLLASHPSVFRALQKADGLSNRNTRRMKNAVPQENTEDLKALFVYFNPLLLFLLLNPFSFSLGSMTTNPPSSSTNLFLSFFFQSQSFPHLSFPNANL